VSVNTPPPGLFAGDLVACGRFITNLKTGERRVLDIHPGSWVVAFDGAYAADQAGGVIRLEDGRRTVSDRASADGCVFAIRDGRAYGVRTARGAATFFVADMGGSESVKTLLAVEAEGLARPRIYANGVVSCGPVLAFWNAKGLFVSDGRAWQYLR
jgi:hypothetical protein